MVNMHLPNIYLRSGNVLMSGIILKTCNPGLHILMTIDEKSYEGGEMGASHPMAWYHKFDGGKAFYTELGHTNESYEDPLFLIHILGGIQYAAK